MRSLLELTRRKEPKPEDRLKDAFDFLNRENPELPLHPDRADMAVFILDGVVRALSPQQVLSLDIEPRSRVSLSKLSKEQFTESGDLLNIKIYGPLSGRGSTFTTMRARIGGFDVYEVSTGDYSPTGAFGELRAECIRDARIEEI